MFLPNHWMLSQRKKRLLGLVVLGALVGILHEVFADDETTPKPKPPAFGDGDLIAGLNATLLGGILGTGSDGSGGLLGLLANTTNITGLLGGLTAPGGLLSNTGEGLFSPESKAAKVADDKIIDALDKLDKALTGDGKANNSYVGLLGVLGVNVTSALAYRTIIGGLRGASGTVLQKAVGANATVDDSWTGMAKDIAADAVADQVLGEDGKEPKLGRNVADVVKLGLNKTLNISDGGVVEKVGETYDKEVGTKLKGTIVENYARETIKGTVKGALNNGVVEGALDGKRRRKRKKRVAKDIQNGMQSLPVDNVDNPGAAWRGG